MTLDPSARYVTSTSAFERLTVQGPLTDRRIEHYALLGRYGLDAQRQAESRRRKKQQPTLSKRLDRYV